MEAQNNDYFGPQEVGIQSQNSSLPLYNPEAGIGQWNLRKTCRLQNPAWVIAPSERLHLNQDLIFFNFNQWPFHPGNEAVIFRDEPVCFSLCVLRFSSHNIHSIEAGPGSEARKYYASPHCVMTVHHVPSLSLSFLIQKITFFYFD